MKVDGEAVVTYVSGRRGVEIFGGARRKSSQRLGFMSMQVNFSEKEGRRRHSMVGESGGL